METIYNTTKPFNFEELSLAHPNGLQGGSYFTKISYLGNNLYIQTGQCETKNGINKTNKKAYCDLMFPTTDETTVRWFEQLEKICIDYIYEKRSIWFHNELERDEIETNFVSPLRLYKSGKYYLIRVYLANNSLVNNLFKCYDENSHPVSYDILQQQNINVIPLLEIQGIKFTSRNFSLDIGLKQIMVLEKPDFLQKCFIKKDLGKRETTQPLEKVAEVSDPPLETVAYPPLEEVSKASEVSTKSLEKTANPPLKNASTPPLEETAEVSDPPLEESSAENPEQSLEKASDPPLEENAEASNPEQPLEETAQASDPPLEETAEASDPPLEDNLQEHQINYDSLAKEDELVTLKNPEEVYYDIWYEARKRAKNARDEAIKAYLEAKKIKATYMLDEYSDSEDEFDEYVADE